MTYFNNQELTVAHLEQDVLSIPSTNMNPAKIRVARPRFAWGERFSRSLLVWGMVQIPFRSIQIQHSNQPRDSGDFKTFNQSGRPDGQIVGPVQLLKVCWLKFGGFLRWGHPNSWMVDPVKL